MKNEISCDDKSHFQKHHFVLNERKILRIRVDDMGTIVTKYYMYLLDNLKQDLIFNCEGNIKRSIVF